MKTLATVIIPTHNHGPTLFYALASALKQTIQNIEIFVIGDGVPAITREIVAKVMQQDPRVKFFDNPKGPRHGEIYRHVALQQARGEIVCYLSDDDIWLPYHIETLYPLLQHNDFAHTLPVMCDPSGKLQVLAVDLGMSYYRTLLLSGENRIPLPCSAHTLAMYRQLPYGWRTTPKEIPTDLYMFQQFLAHPHCRAASSFIPTIVHFPSPRRTTWTIEERLQELESWRTNLEKGTLQFMLQDLLNFSAQQLSYMENHYHHQAQAMENTAIYRFRNFLLRIPLLGKACQSVAKFLAGAVAH